MSDAKATAAGTAGTDSALQNLKHEELALPQQVDELTRELVQWVRTDSLGIVAGVGVGIALYAFLVLVRGYARKRLKRSAAFGSWSWVALKVLARTRSFFLAMASAKAVAALFSPPAGWGGLITFLFSIAAAVQGAFWAREFLVALVERKALDRDSDPAMSSAVGVLTVIINVVVWALAAIILLDNIGVNVTALVAGLGIGGIAIGLAAQGIFSDLFAALAILLDRPFRVGDTIQAGGPQGVIGTVEHIGLKTTRLRALSGEVVVMSNTNLLNQQINNFANFTHRRVLLRVRVLYQTRPGILEAIPAEFQRIVNSVPHCRFDRAHLLEFAVSALDYELVLIVEQEDQMSMLDARQAVMLAIIRRFAELGIDFAIPAQISFLADREGRIVDPKPADDEKPHDVHRRAGPAAATPAAGAGD